MAISAQNAQLGSLFLWEPESDSVLCLSDQTVAERCVYVGEVDAFFVYQLTYGHGSYYVKALGLVSRSPATRSWRYTSTELYRLEPDKSGAAIERFVHRGPNHIALSNLAPCVNAERFRAGWSSRLSSFVIESGESIYAIPIVRDDSGVVSLPEHD